MAERAETVFTNHIGCRALVGSLSDFFVRNKITPFDARSLLGPFGVKRVTVLVGIQIQLSRPYRRVESRLDL